MGGQQEHGGVELYGDGAMTVAKASAFTGIGRTVLYEMMGRGELPFSQVGARRLITRRALVELLARNGTVACGC